MKKLKKIRQLKKFTQKKLSSVSGVPQSTISRIEQGDHKKGVNIEHFRKIANALGVSLDELVSDDEKIKSLNNFSA